MKTEADRIIEVDEDWLVLSEYAPPDGTMCVVLTEKDGLQLAQWSLRHGAFRRQTCPVPVWFWYNVRIPTEPDPGALNHVSFLRGMVEAGYLSSSEAPSASVW